MNEVIAFGSTWAVPSGRRYITIDVVGTHTVRAFKEKPSPMYTGKCNPDNIFFNTVAGVEIGELNNVQFAAWRETL